MLTAAMDADDTDSDKEQSKDDEGDNAVKMVVARSAAARNEGDAGKINTSCRTPPLSLSRPKELW